MTYSWLLKYALTRYFNSHPHEEDDLTAGVSVSGKLYFNSHPHEEDDRNQNHIHSSNSISTHILTKRMTISILLYGLSVRISTHILTKRMTLLTYSVSGATSFQLTSSRRGWRITHHICENLRHFNSHPHEEDDIFTDMMSYSQGISTHILTKRMTLRYGG